MNAIAAMPTDVKEWEFEDEFYVSPERDVRVSAVPTRLYPVGMVKMLDEAAVMAAAGVGKNWRKMSIPRARQFARKMFEEAFGGTLSGEPEVLDGH